MEALITVKTPPKIRPRDSSVVPSCRTVKAGIRIAPRAPPKTRASNTTAGVSSPVMPMCWKTGGKTPIATRQVPVVTKATTLNERRRRVMRCWPRTPAIATSPIMAGPNTMEMSFGERCSTFCR